MAGPSTDTALVRRVLSRELDTINEYEAMAQSAEDPTIRAFLLHLAQEEKEHVAEAMALIRGRDADQDAKSTAVDVRPDHFTGGAPAPSRTAPSAAAPSGLPRSFTVGSLKGR
jgi:hypothetical protein